MVGKRIEKLEAERVRIEVLKKYEYEYAEYTYICGIDEAGRGPLAGPVVDVITLAKRDLQAGEVLDGIGGFTCYGVAENAEVCQAENLLPMGLSEGCRLKRNVPRDYPLTYTDVELPENRLCDRLRQEQNRCFMA